MPNYRLQIGKITIPLPTNFDTTLRIQNPYMSIELVGDYTFQFQIPKDDISRQVFGDVEAPNVGVISQQSYACIMFADDFIIFEGFCNLRKASNFSYSIDLTKTPGNIQKSVFEQKVNSIDFGQYQIPTNQATTGIWSIADDQIDIANTPRKFGDSFNKGSVKTTVTIDNQVVFISERRARLSGAIDSDWDTKRTQYNESQNNVEIIDADQNLHFIFGDILNHTCKIKIERFFSRDGIGGSTVSEFLAKQITYQSIGNFPDKTIETTWAEPFFYPMIQNDKAYDSESYSGTINNNTGTNVLPTRGGPVLSTIYYLNTYQKRDAFGLSPAFELLWIFKKVCNFLGFEVVSEVLNDEDIKSIYLAGSRGQDKQCPSTKLVFNIYDEKIIYKDYMPDWTIKEFLESFKILTGTGLDFNPITGKVYVKLLNEVINNSQKVDYNDNLGFLITNNVLYKKKYQLKFADAQEDDRYKPVPSDESLKNEENVQNLPLKFIPALMKTLTDSGLDWGSNRNQTANIILSETILFEQKLNSPIYGQSSESIQHRIFYKKRNADNKIIISNNGKNLDLRIDGAKGIYAQKLKTFLDFLNSIEEYETIIALNPYELTTLELDKPIHGYHVDLFIYQIEVKLPLKETCVIRLWRR